MNTYTGPNGGTIAGQQLNIGNQQMADFNSATPQQLEQAKTNATQSMANIQSPGYRSDVLASSDIPGMQVNYDDLARQLYEYDQMHLKPIYAQAPDQPSDALSYGRVGASALAQLTPELAAAPGNTLYADNPKYAMASQVNQKNSVLEALDALNIAIEREGKQVRGKYASTVDSQLALLKGIQDLITNKREDQKLQLEIEKANKKDTGLTQKELLELQLKGEEKEKKLVQKSDGSYEFVDMTPEEKVGVGFSKLPAAQKTKIADYMKFISELKRIKTNFERVYSPDRTGWWNDMMNVSDVSGPISGMMGAYGGAAGDVRTDLNTLNVEVKKGFYGTAVSATEKQDAKSFLPSSNAQETENLSRLRSILEKKENEVRSVLRTYGVSEGAIDILMSKTEPDQQPTVLNLSPSDEELIQKYKNAK